MPHAPAVPETLAAVLETVAAVLALLPVLLLLASGPALLHPRARRGPNLAALGAGIVLAVALPLGWQVGARERGTVVGAVAVVTLLLIAQVGFVLAVLLLRWGWLAWSVRRHPPRQAAAIVVLGAGLVGTRVTLILAERLLAAIRLHGSLSLPADRTGRSGVQHPPAERKPPAERHTGSGRDTASAGRRGLVPLVVSGGQGPDEVTSEAAAMAAFLVERGFDPTGILLEDRSTSTRENLVLSAALVAERTPSVTSDLSSGAPPSSTSGRIIIVTNGFHVFRTHTLARALRLDVVVVGGRTPLHYLPRALTRELVAVLTLHPRRQVATAAVLVVLGTWAGLG